MSDSSTITLHGYFRSSCTGRLRIALAIKSLDYKYVPINLLKDGHQDDAYAQLNPSRTVPTLHIHSPQEVLITQSMAALNYLEEAYPDTTPLLPPASDLVGRAQVHALAEIIACDVQPVTNMKILRKATSLGYGVGDWAREFMAPGFSAFETLIEKTAGRYSYGDQVTWADLCLAPAMWNAERFELDLTPYPTIVRVYGELRELPAFQKAHWQNQPDCPENLKS